MKSIQLFMAGAAAAMFATMFPARAHAGEMAKVEFGGESDTSGEVQFELTELNGDDVIRCVKVETEDGNPDIGEQGGVETAEELRDAVFEGLTNPRIPGFLIQKSGATNILITRDTGCYK